MGHKHCRQYYIVWTEPTPVQSEQHKAIYCKYLSNIFLPKFEVHYVQCVSLFVRKMYQPPAGLEPAIPGLGGRCLIHWATEARITYYIYREDRLLSILLYFLLRQTADLLFVMS